jgi:hypothetical protein
MIIGVNMEMMIIDYIAYYGLLGVIIGFFMEKAIISSEQTVKWQERFWLITLWPIMLVIFIFHFIKALFDK